MTTEGEGSTLHPENYASWNPAQLADYLKTQDLGDYTEMVIQHSVTGKVAPRLEDKDLREMGISSVGDRLRFKEALDDLQKASRKAEREKVIWEGKEELWFSWWEQACGTCCGCCPVDPATYTLTGNRLTFKQEKPCRFGPIRCCCGHTFFLDNVDLTYITDVDMTREAPPCCKKVLCCGNSRDHIHVKTATDGTKTLHLVKGQGEPVSTMILNQVEECQVMERD